MANYRMIRQLFFLLCLVGGGLFSTSSAQTCKSQTFSSNKAFATCTDLPSLNGYIHWTYNPSTGTVDIAYKATPASSGGWVAWAINPSGGRMVGSQAILGYVDSGNLKIITINVDSLTPSFQNVSLSFPVSNLGGEISGNDIILYATLTLNSTTVNQVWQTGNVISGTPGAHLMKSDNLRSVGTLNLLSGQSTTAGGGTNSKIRRKNIHGVLNAVSWGTLMPLGAIIARYMRVFKSADPAWFYLHVTCQCSAYILGVAGWGTGLKLGSDSKGIEYTLHRNIGITLFCLGTLQVFALLLRPKKDHKYRIYWNVYHHSIGYTVIILSIINIYKGLGMLTPDKKWKHAYTGVIIALGVIAVILEAITWGVVLKRKSRSSEEKSHHGVNIANGYGGRV